MAQAVKDSFLDLERHRQLLEENIEKLRKSLLHWQIWEAEYEGLKEEILAARSTPTRAELLAIGRDYEGELVTQKELEDILGTKEARTAGQVVNLLDRRIDYVEQNVRTIQKQIETAEDKLAAATIISTPEVRNEDGLPLTEIMEELDDEGNVVSSHLSTPGSMKPQLLEALQKAGVKDIVPEPAAESISEKEPPAAFLETAPEPVKKSPKPTKKGVKFAEDTKPGPEPEKSKTAKRLEDIMKIAKEQETPPSEPPVIPTNETAEDAALRREMLQYGMSEIGSVVAELDLEEGSDWSDDDYDDTSSFDDEDAFGRSTGKLVDEELRQQMIELEERLGVRAMHNVGKDAGEYDVVQEGIGRITINGHEDSFIAADLADAKSTSNTNEQSPTTSAKKSVRFSEELDISPAPVPAAPSSPVKKQRGAAPVGDIVERKAPAEASAPTPQKKASRFKSARSAAPNVLNGPLASTNASKSSSLPLHAAKPSTPKPFSTSIQFSPAEDPSRIVPTGPEGKVMAPTIVERETTTNTSPVEPDEFDPHLLHQEVATEYHKMRNRMIQKQGGFMKEDESEIVPFTEEEGGPKKVSRFKAARLARS
ncbi:Prefoldin subunit-domain-containing protein [Leptodontidium sp. MPI-SDFR-AT-0119]|nr:Prefoldin subunit-domain-containing protein [Leptodontidium sp. MPI-SDFR-AT-0119]